MRYSAQIRAARALLGISQGELAKRAKVGIITLHRLEQPERLIKAQRATLARIQTALERAGITFLEDKQGIGVVIARDKGRKP